MTRFGLRAGVLELRRATMSRRDRGPVSLTPAEVRVLSLLAAAGGEVVPRAALFEAWGARSDNERVVDTVIHRLRTKLELDPRRPDHLHTAHSEGYRLVVERPPPLRLPAEPGPLFGRQRAVDRVRTSSFAALTGPPGIGKSRVLLAAAHRRADRVLWVDVERCDTDDALFTATARALGIEVGGASSVERRVLEALMARSVDAVYFDHGESLAASGVFARVRDGAAVAVAVASRSAVAGADGIALEPLEADEAEALFLHHAASVDAPWVADPVAVGQVPAVVARLERVPLAIVLAAGRSAALGPRALLERLDDRLRLLTARGGDARHRTLRAALDLSWDRLSGRERRAAAACAVFVGGFDAAAAAAVADADAATTDALCAASLLTRTGDRFGCYAFVRDYAAERLAEDPGRASTAAERHLEWFAAYGRGFDRADVQGGRVADRDNLRAALERATATRPERVAPLAWALVATFLGDVPVESARDVLRRALEAPVSTEDRAVLLARLAAVEQVVGGDAEAHAAEAVALAKECGSSSALTLALRALGTVQINRGALNEALEVLGAAAALARADQVPVRLARVLVNLARAELAAGRADDALATIAEGERVTADAGLDEQRADFVRFRSLVLRFQGRYEPALDAVRDAIGRFGALGHLRGRLAAVESAIGLYLELGDAASAAAGLAELVSIQEQLGTRENASARWSHEGGLAKLEGDWVRAVRCYRVALDEAERTSQFTRVMVERVNLGEAVARTGDVAAGEGWIAEATRQLRARGYRRSLGEAVAIHAWALIRCGRLSEAEVAAAEALDAAQHVRSDHVRAVAYAVAGLVAVAAGGDGGPALREAERFAGSLAAASEGRRWVAELRAAIG